MQVAVDAVLNHRLRSVGGGTRPATWATSVVLHVAAAVLGLGLPLLAARPEPIEFVAVQIVPVQALGVRQPEPQPAAEEEERRQKPPEAPPEPEARPPERLPPPERPARQPEAEPRPAAPAPPPARAQREGSPLGSSTGTTAFGAASVAGLDSPDFVYGYWVDQMLGMIAAEWDRPPLGGDVTAVLYFRVHRDGSISGLRLTTSSGYNSFDLGGLRAVQLAAPFPPLPQSFNRESLGVQLILR